VSPSNVSLRSPTDSVPTSTWRAWPSMASAPSVVRDPAAPSSPSDAPGRVNSPQAVASNPATPTRPNQKLARAWSASRVLPHDIEKPSPASSWFDSTLPVKPASTNIPEGRPIRVATVARGICLSSASTVRVGSTSSDAPIATRAEPGEPPSG
jgi:hypothetical protein